MGKDERLAELLASEMFTATEDSYEAYRKGVLNGLMMGGSSGFLLGVFVALLAFAKISTGG
jgi:hypothetical protein